MDFFDWAIEGSEHPTNHLSLLVDGVDGVDGTGGGQFWNDYYSLNNNPFDTHRAFPSGNSPLTNPEPTRNNNIYTSQSDGSIEEADSRRESETSPTSIHDYAVNSGRDPMVNRIQRRRTQNRNSQRIYRQRRVEERQKFEDRAIAAEAASKKMNVQFKELESLVVSLKGQVERLEAENLALRSSTSSMPWRSSHQQ